jgi:hypothetical protein
MLSAVEFEMKTAKLLLHGYPNNTMMASVTERLSQIGLPPNVMPEILFQEGSLTDEQRQIILDSIDELTDFDNVMSTNEEHPVVCSYISFVVAFVDGFPGEEEWKHHISYKLAIVGRILMDKTQYELTPMQKGFIINSAVRFLLLVPRFEFERARQNRKQVAEITMDVLNGHLPAIEAGLEKEFLIHLNETDPLGMSMFFEAIFYEIGQFRLWFIPTEFAIHEFIEVMSRFSSIVKTHGKPQKILLDEYCELIAHINAMRIGLLGQFKDSLGDEEVKLYHQDISMSSAEAIMIFKAEGADTHPLVYVENLCNFVYFVMPGVVEILGDEAPKPDDEFWPKYLNDLDGARDYLNQLEGGKEIPKIGGGLFSLYTHLEIARKRFQEWMQE